MTHESSCEGLSFHAVGPLERTATSQRGFRLPTPLHRVFSAVLPAGSKTVSRPSPDVHHLAHSRADPSRRGRVLRAPEDHRHGAGSGLAGGPGREAHPGRRAQRSARSDLGPESGQEGEGHRHLGPARGAARSRSLKLRSGGDSYAHARNSNSSHQARRERRLRACSPGFRPALFVELHRESNGNVTFALGATHHGFRADASDVDGELEQIINEIRRAHPTNLID